MEKKGLNPAPLFLPPTGMDRTGLIPPSHFEMRRPGSTPPPLVPSSAPSADSQAWAELKKELEKLKQENEALKIRQDRGDGPRARTLDYLSSDVPPTESRALEIIAHQMREIRKLELAVADAHKKEEARQRLLQEVQILKEERTEAEQREERRKQEEERRRQLEEAAERRRQDELLLLSEQHRMQLDTLRGQVSELEMALQEVQKQKVQEVAYLREELQSANEKRVNLENQLSQSHIELESQNSLVQQLRTYIGELVPDNRHTEEQRREIAELKSTIQTLEKEREALQTSMSLLQTRLSSLTHILSLQESDLCKKAGTHMDGQKTQLLLKRWREKVFSLMVQLKSEEINKESDEQKIQERICSLENSLQESNQQLVLHSHALQDRTAELEIERLRIKSLQDELCAAHTTSTHLTRRAEKAEQTSLKLKSMIDGFVQALDSQEKTFRGALQRLVTLGQRVSFATKRVDTIQGMVAQRLTLVKLAQDEKPKHTVLEDDGCPSYEDLKNEVQLLNEERDRLSTELKRSALILEGRVTETREKLEAEIAECHHTASLLRQSLHETEEREKVLTMQVTELERKLQEAYETAEQLKEQLQDQKGEYERELQHKVREVEEKTTRQLAEMEKHLHETRREHTKAVVALRQTERQMQRERNRSQETMRTLEDAARLREERLTGQLRDAERDKNLMTATLRQEGLLVTYQKNRTAAIQSSVIRTEEDHRPAGTPGAAGSKESLSNMLANLQSLGAALLKEDVDNEEEDEELM
ncbi:PREDICTED: coiled-coil alpha-helical rod protein 1 [Nanorana parkeri]|uniref:coiled-coil alpha-helical rod protein 1 n=1 Tax=Nanorana parkeri TaxID=125878 RepID=UPI0008543D9F|nr:PREDICTED: coiled-coil alpha-helical rod protein 1 [Nanorana parkeri]